MTKWTDQAPGGDRGSVALEARHVVVIHGSDRPALARHYGALCLSCSARVPVVYMTPDKARKALDRAAGHVE